MINQMKPQRRKTQNHLLKESLLLPQIQILHHIINWSEFLSTKFSKKNEIQILSKSTYQRRGIFSGFFFDDRKHNSDNEENTIPGRTGIYHKGANASEELMHDIPYLAAINASPKKYYTVQEILTQVKAKAKVLGLTCQILYLIIKYTQKIQKFYKIPIMLI